MNAIYQPRQIIDRRQISAALDAMGDAKGEAGKRSQLVEEIKAAYKTGFDVIRTRFEQGKASGEDTVAAHSYLMDQVIRILFDAATAHFVRRGVPTTGERVSVVAIGGYGRGELAPLSDVDLLFLLPYKPTPFSEQLVEFMLYLLWDLGLKVGHAVRSVNENITHAKADMTIRTTLLDARWIWGDQELAAELISRFKKEVQKGTAPEFVQAKLTERDERHSKLGDSRYRLEPNVKEDKGGLRDLHTLYWIAKYIYGVSDVRKLADRGIIDDEAAARFIKAHDFLSTVRCHMHYITGRTDNRLTFDLQREIAPKLGYVDRAGATAVERFMKHYFLVARDVGDLTRIFCTLLEETGTQKKRSIFRLPMKLRQRNIDGFIVERGRIGIADESVFTKDPVKLLSIFRTAQEHELDFQPSVLRIIAQLARRVTYLRRDPEANRVFMDILTSRKGPETTLRLMSECGIFGRFIPDFGRVVAQMQYDMYHVYTTDEHTIRAIGILHRIEQGKLKEALPVASDVVQKIQSRRALYVAVLLHDIAKGRGGDHSDLGADVAMQLCPRLGLSAEETETVAWLVRHHLKMSNTAFKRDLDDPQTISKFCEVVQSPERLKLLLVLTCADIRAVGPAVWNNWKATLLRDLYRRTDDVLRGGQTGAIDARVLAAKAVLAERLNDWPEKMRESILSLGSRAFWLSNDTDTHERLAHFMRAAEEVGEKIAIDFTIDSYRDVTHMVIYTPDHPGLFAKIAGALAIAGVSVVDANILTLSNSMALDTFSLQDFEGHAIPDNRFARIKSRIISALEGRLRLNQELPKAGSRLPSRVNALEVPPRVIIDNNASKVCSVVEINGHDRPGFLSDVTKAIADLGLQIFSAHISTYGERVVDVFYVKDVFGMKIEHGTKIRQIREALGKAIGVTADAVHVTQPDKAKPAPAKAEKAAEKASEKSGDKAKIKAAE